jgi:putative PIN family toxin of toxin-antitoxin system
MGKKNRIIIDTNLWISFLLSKQFSFLDELLTKQSVQLVFSQELLSEFLDVVNRPKLKKYFSDESVAMVLELIDQYAEFVVVTSSVDVCRDSKDNFLLSLAKDGSVDFLITGDQDLLVIESFVNTEILTISEFEQRIKIS